MIIRQVVNGKDEVFDLSEIEGMTLDDAIAIRRLAVRNTRIVDEVLFTRQGGFCHPMTMRDIKALIK